MTLGKIHDRKGDDEWGLESMLTVSTVSTVSIPSSEEGEFTTNSADTLAEMEDAHSAKNVSPASTMTTIEEEPESQDRRPSRDQMCAAIFLFLIMAFWIVLAIRMPMPPPCSPDSVPFNKYDGQGGHPFDAGWNSSGVARVLVNAGCFVDGLELQYRQNLDDENGSFSTTGWFGGTSGQRYEFNVTDPNDYINNISVWYGWGVDALQFHTVLGNSSLKFGGDGGDFHPQVAPNGYQLAGMHGRSGSLLDKVEFVWKPVGS